MLQKICVLAILSLSGYAQATAQGAISKEAAARIAVVEDSLVMTADSMYSAPLPEDRDALSARFARQLVRALKVENSWDYTFDKLAAKINVIYPQDKSFRIFNWATAPTEITRDYYGAIQLNAPQLKLYGLADYSRELGKGLADSVLTGGKWMGCIYYRIIDKEVDGRKIYTLFGLNAGGTISNKKFLDALELTEEGPRFGAQIFGIRSEGIPTQRVNRFVLEYKKDVQVSMNWDDDLKLIFFDRLVSQVNDPGRKYTYVPSGQYDGFRWVNGEWRLVQDVISPLQLKDGEAPVGQPKQ